MTSPFHGKGIPRDKDALAIATLEHGSFQFTAHDWRLWDKSVTKPPRCLRQRCNASLKTRVAAERHQAASIDKDASLSAYPTSVKIT